MFQLLMPSLWINFLLLAITAFFTVIHVLPNCNECNRHVAQNHFRYEQMLLMPALPNSMFVFYISTSVSHGWSFSYFWYRHLSFRLEFADSLQPTGLPCLWCFFYDLSNNVKKMIKKWNEFIMAFLINRIVLMNNFIALFSNCFFYWCIRHLFFYVSSQ